jgi:hypothetical protein
MCNIQLNMLYHHQDEHKTTNNARAKGTTKYVPKNSRLLYMVYATRICRRNYTGSDNMLVIS